MSGVPTWTDYDRLHARITVLETLRRTDHAKNTLTGVPEELQPGGPPPPGEDTNISPRPGDYNGGSRVQAGAESGETPTSYGASRAEPVPKPPDPGGKLCKAYRWLCKETGRQLVIGHTASTGYEFLTKDDQYEEISAFQRDRAPLPAGAPEQYGDGLVYLADWVHGKRGRQVTILHQSTRSLRVTVTTEDGALSVSLDIFLVNFLLERARYLVFRINQLEN